MKCWQRLKAAMDIENFVVWLALGMLVILFVYIMFTTSETNRRADRSAERSEWLACLMYNQALEGDAETLIDRREAIFEADLITALFSEDEQRRIDARQRLARSERTFGQALAEADAILAQRRICVEPPSEGKP